MKRWRRIALIFIGYFEALIFSGIIFGWPSLLYILQQEGVYSKLCGYETNIVSSSLPDNLWPVHDNQSVTNAEIYLSSLQSFQVLNDSSLKTSVNCNERDNAFTLVYIVATATYGITAILIGFSLDHFGLWATRFCGSALTIAGFFCLVFTTKETSWLLWPGLNLLALGTNQLKVCSYQFTNLWPSKRSTILSFYGSAFAISTTIYTFAQYLYRLGVPYKALLLTLACISILTIPTTFLMPVMKVKEHIGKDKKKIKKASISVGLSGLNKEIKNRPDLLPIKIETCESEIPTENAGLMNGSTDTETEQDLPLSYSLFSLSAFLYVYWHFVSFFIVLFYSVSFNSWVYKSTDDPNEVAHYTGIMGMCQLLGPFIIPLIGVFTDWRVAEANKSEDPIERLALTLEAPTYGKVATTIALICVMTCKMFVNKHAVYASMLLIAVSRPLTHASFVSYVRLRFPGVHFNRLLGIFTTVTAILMCVQYPFFVWMFSSDDNFVAANWLLMGALVSSLISPLHLMIKKVSMKYAKDQCEYISIKKSSKL